MTLKSVKQIQHKLTRDWANADLRECRLLNENTWPLEINLGKVSANEFIQQNAQLKSIVETWRHIDIGVVNYQDYKFRSATHTVSLPRSWVLNSVTEWITATASPEINSEHIRLQGLLNATDKQFHKLLIRQRNLIQKTNADDVILANKIVLNLAPGIAKKKPLRAFSFFGSDSKFFERNRQLLTLMMGCRFGDNFLGHTLETFLDADLQNQHWLLIIPLDEQLLPFKQLRLRSSELAHTALPGTHLVIIENERCAHQLPTLSNTIAILGAGRDLNWLKAEWLNDKKIAYWGDIDTWGLQLLGDAREHCTNIEALMMNQGIFDSHSHACVIEHQPSSEDPPQTCTQNEQALYRYLLQQTKGRLEQEFINIAIVKNALRHWRIG